MKLSDDEHSNLVLYILLFLQSLINELRGMLIFEEVGRPLFDQQKLLS